MVTETTTSTTTTTTVSLAFRTDDDNVADDTEPNEAAEALLALSTIGRDVDLETMDEMVKKIIADSEHKDLLPALIFYIRNHKKSNVSKKSGTSGLGEKIIAEKLLISLYHIDKDAAIGLVHCMVSYGYFGSLCNILDLTTELAVENEDKDYYLSLWNRIYDIFVVQLLHDKEQAD